MLNRTAFGSSRAPKSWLGKIGAERRPSEIGARPAVWIVGSGAIMPIDRGGGFVCISGAAGEPAIAGAGRASVDRSGAAGANARAIG
jgi:hypothetical protein